MNHKLLSSLKHVQTVFLAIAIAYLFGSCTTIRIVKVDAPTADCAGSGQHLCHDTLIRASLWNGRKGKQDINCGCANGMSRIKVSTKPMDVVLGFLTAGFVVKQRIEWDCAQRSGDSGGMH